MAQESIRFVIRRSDGQFYYKGHVSSMYGFTEDFNKAFLFESERGAKSRLYTAGEGFTAEIVPVIVAIKPRIVEKFGWKDASVEKPDAGATVLVQDSLGNLALGYVDANGDWWIERYDDEDLANGFNGFKLWCEVPDNVSEYYKVRE